MMAVTIISAKPSEVIAMPRGPLVEQLGVASLSKSQVSEMAQHLDGQVEAFRNRPLDAEPYTFVWVDALAVNVRDGGPSKPVPGRRRRVATPRCCVASP